MPGHVPRADPAQPVGPGHRQPQRRSAGHPRRQDRGGRELHLPGHAPGAEGRLRDLPEHGAGRDRERRRASSTAPTARRRRPASGSAARRDDAGPPERGARRAAGRARAPSRAGPHGRRRDARWSSGSSVRNTSRVRARGVVLRDLLPQGMVLAVRTGGVRISGRTLTWRVGDVPAGRTVTRTVRVRILSGAAGRICNAMSARRPTPAWRATRPAPPSCGRSRGRCFRGSRASRATPGCGRSGHPPGAPAHASGGSAGP